MSISEDATPRIDYDSESDRLIGFVLPCNDEGLPLADSFLATTFEKCLRPISDQNMSMFTWLNVCLTTFLHIV